ncbi:MAG: cysteine peptidase family C39 domain-containing protein [Cyanophyceae cyanobacterium]
MKFKLRFFKQETVYSCVPACLRTVIASFGMEMSEAELRLRCDCTPLGTEALIAVDAARQLGFSKTVKCTLTTEELKAQIDSDVHPLVFIDLLPVEGIKSSHAVVVEAIAGEPVLVIDPLSGSRLLPRSTFDAA